MSLKSIKKGDSVIVKGFTGIKLGVFTVAKATDKTITVEKKDGNLMIFSKKDGKQTNTKEGKERYANTVMEDDGSYVKPNSGRRKKAADNKPAKKPAKKAVKKKESEDIEDEFYEDDEDFEDDDFEGDDFEELD